MSRYDPLDHVGAGTIVLVDKAYDADRIRVFRERNLIERFLSKLKHFRRVATHNDKLPEIYLGMIQLASMCLWLRAFESTS